MIKLKIKVHTIRILHTDAQTHKLTSRAFLKKEVKNTDLELHKT